MPKRWLLAYFPLAFPVIFLFVVFLIFLGFPLWIAALIGLFLANVTIAGIWVTL